MRTVDLDALVLVADRLTSLGVNFTFLGGAVVGFLLDNPRIPFPRQTNDVDAIAEVATRIQYADLEERLRTESGFHHDTSEGAPRCRWLVDGVKVDLMPMKDPGGSLDNLWFEYALQTATQREMKGVRLPVISASCFLATKLMALSDRGKGDFRASHDLEDMVTVIDGRASLCNELANERDDLRQTVAAGFKDLLAQAAFNEALPGHLLSDDASQARLSSLQEKLNNIADLSG
jgi:predicted nucleotidyltransferase